MRAGRLDRSISILRKSVALTQSGAEIETWRPLGSLSRAASLSPLKGDERFSADQVVASEQVEFQVRWSTDIADLSPLDRIVTPALALTELEGSPPDLVPDAEIADRRQYDIIAVHELGRREGLRIQAARRVDGVELVEAIP